MARSGPKMLGRIAKFAKLGEIGGLCAALLASALEPACTRIHGFGDRSGQSGSGQGQGQGQGPGQSGDKDRGPWAPGSEAAANRLGALVAEQLDAELQFSPTLATWLGDHTSDDRLDDVRLETVAHEVSRLDNLLDRLRLAREGEGEGEGTGMGPARDMARAVARDSVSTRDSDRSVATTADLGVGPLAHDAVTVLAETMQDDEGASGHDGGAGGGISGQRQRQQDLDRILLQARIEARRFELVEWRPHERNPLFYANLIAFGLDSLLGPSLTTPAGLRALRGRLAAIPAVCREAQRNLKNPPELWTRRAIDVTQMTRDFVAGLLPRMLANLNLNVETKLQDEVNHHREVAQRALEDFGVWLSHELLPRSKGDWALSAERLQARLRASELLDVRLETVQERAEYEHRETRRRLEELAKRLTGIANAGRAVSEAQRLIEEDHPRPEELAHTVEQTLDKAYELAASANLLTVPAQRPRVVEMPAYRFGYLQVSLPAPLETEMTAQLLLDPVDPSWKDKKRISDHLRMLNRAQILMTVSHEVMPGRFAQQQAQRDATATLSPLRQRTRSLAFLEGWAGYAEQLTATMLSSAPALQPGPVAGPVVERLQLLVLRQQLLRLGRLIVALRLHAPAPGSPPPSARIEEAEDFLAEECYLDEYAARREVERATYDPLYGAAALGRLQLLALRADYQAEHHDDFTLKGFHDAVLAQGALPVVALRMLLLRHHRPSLRSPEEPEPTEPTERIE